MAKARQEMAVQGENPMVLTERPSFLPTEAKGRGSEEVTFNDIVVPRLSIIQSLSPQRSKNKEEYIPGAEEGMFFNTVTKKLYSGDQGVYFVPVYFRPEWVLWKKRTEGGGFIGAYSSVGEGQHALATQSNREAMELLDTAQHFCLVLDPASTIDAPVVEEVVISMAKSQLKASRNLNSLAKLVGGDRFSRAYRLSTVQVNGPKGDYYNWKIEPTGFPPEAVYRRAESMYESVISGKRTIDRAADDTVAHDNEI